MTRIGRFLAMPWREQSLLMGALFVVAAVRIGLWLLPLPQIRRLATKPSRPSPAIVGFPPAVLAWAVRAAARFVPRASCLTQALSLKWLLTRAGHAAELRVGVARGEQGGLDSHAWVENNGCVLIGQHSELERYAQILVMGTEP